jgi:DNA-binding beta-propeller fold protein YncE
MGESRGPGRFVSRLAHRRVIGLALATSALLVVAATALAATGDLTQPPGAAGCFNDDGSEGCADGHGLVGPIDVAVSPDRKNVYVANHDFLLSDGDDSSVARFNVNLTTGKISQPPGTAGCVSESGRGPCADGHALIRAYAVEVSPDGKSVYVASENAVARFVRNPDTGRLSQPAGATGCISDPAAFPAVEPCADGHAIGGITGDLAVSRDGKSVYLANLLGATGFGSVARLNRNPTTGAISQPPGAAGCITEDGSGPCADGHGLKNPLGVAVSPDGKSVYAASYVSNAVVRLARNTTTGAISQPAGTAGCVSEDGEGSCANGHALDAAFKVAVSPDGENVYAATQGSDSVVRFDRNTTTGAIVQPPDSDGCISESGAGRCQDGDGLNAAQGIAVSRDGKSIYVSSGDPAVARIDRRTTDGRISQPSEGRCINEDGSGACADGHGFSSGGGFESVAVSPGGRRVYATTARNLLRFIRTP